MTLSRPHPMTASEAAFRREQELRVKNDVHRKYKKFFRDWHGTRYANEHREYLFHHVHAIRQGEIFGQHKHIFFDRNLEVHGPYDLEEICYAAWLLYMEAQD